MIETSKKIIGSEEWYSFPTIGLPAIKARVDSGAKTSSLHAFNIQQISKNNQKWISYEVTQFKNNRKAVVRCEA